MALRKEVYRELEGVVGPEYISQEPAVLESYRRAWGTDVATDKKRLPRPGAVVLPACTEEVQGIVKVCNKYGIKYKALSTGWIFCITPGEGGIQIDLRRMNRVLEINEENMYAVVEPYVICAHLQGELMKRGLHLNIIGAGSNTTALAPAKAVGVGGTGTTTSCDNRTLLAMEWVLPNGEVMKTGSLGSADEWFCGDGPGPSMRGAARGNMGAYGGIGVFTKAAIKLFHWPGPQVPVVEGTSPHYEFKAPSNMKLHCIGFKTWEQSAMALHRLSENEIATALCRYAPHMLGFEIGNDNQECLELQRRIEKAVSGTVDNIWLVVITGDSKKEFDYKEKVFQQIFDESEAKTISMLEDPKVAEPLMWRFIRVTRSNAVVFRGTGAYHGTMSGTDALAPAVKHMMHDAEYKQQLIEDGSIVDDGGDNNWAVSFENGHYYHYEQLMLYEKSPEAIQAMRKMSEASREFALQNHCPLHFGTGDKSANYYGPHLDNYQEWARKLKKALDPNVVSESSFYFTPKD